MKPTTLDRSQPRPQSPPAVRRTADTLPRPPESGSRRVGTGLLALLGVVVLLVGVPAALVYFVGNPLPTEPPSRDWLTTELTPGLVIDVLAVLVWIVWAHFLVCFLTEWRAIRAGRMPGRVALGGGSQLLARKLVASMLLLAGGAVAAQGVTALQTDDPAAAQSNVATAQSSTQNAYPAPMVSPQERAAFEAEVEIGAAGGVEGRATEVGQREQGLKHYEVKPPHGRNHDTLWDISERLLGDPLRYKEIYELNKGRMQSDGRRLTDADLIQPGWQLRLPADAKGPGVRITPVSSVQTPTSSERPSSLEGTGERTAPLASTLSDLAGDDRGSDPAAEVAEDRTQGIAELLLGGGLVLAGVARALTARRGPFGEPDEDTEALTLAAALRRADLLDNALRGLAEMRQAQREPMPEVRFVYVNDEQVVLHLAVKTSAPEHPWSVAEDGSSWKVRADAVPTPGRGTAAPYPSLVTVAESHGFDLLVDLEMAPGLVSLGGDTRVGREVAMAMALDLATHAWSDRVEVTMVGFGDRLGDLDTQRIRHVSDLDQVLDEAEQSTARQSGVSRELGISGVLQGRLRGAAVECAPCVVFLSGAPTAEQAQRLARLTSAGRTSFSAVCVGDSPSARWRFVVDDDGSFDASLLGVSGTARRLTDAGQKRLKALLAAAATRRERGEDELESTPTAEIASRSLADAESEPAAGPEVAVRAASSSEFSRAAATLRLLGPVTVEGPGRVESARRDLLTEVVAMAALHPEGLHEAVLRASLWPRGVEQDVMDARMRDAQEWLGHDDSGQPRLGLNDDGRWRLTGVATDYGVLASAARGGDLTTLLEALRLGTGEAFSGAGRHYSWLAFAREARQGRLLIASAARRAAELAAAEGRTAESFEALRLGTKLVPTAEPLWRMLLRTVARHESGSLEAEITKMYAVLAEHGVRPEPETDGLVTELAPGISAVGAVL